MMNSKSYPGTFAEAAQQLGKRDSRKLENNTYLRKRVREYARDFVAALKAGEVPAPGAGDCFYCQMRVTSPEAEKGKTLGEVSKGESHVVLHMKDKYYVPSLLARAAEVGGVSQAAMWTLGYHWQPLGEGEQRDPRQNWGMYEQLEKALRKYCYRQVGV